VAYAAAGGPLAGATGQGVAGSRAGSTGGGRSLRVCPWGASSCVPAWGAFVVIPVENGTTPGAGVGSATGVVTGGPVEMVGVVQ